MTRLVYLFAAAAFGLNLCAQINVLTANGSNERSNANLQEILLAPGNVTPDTFGKVATFAVDGQVYAQVLYVSALSIPGQGFHNVIFVCTMHNSVYAFDADGGDAQNPLWQVNLGPSVPSASDITPEIGILGTGAIDLQAGVLYVVAETLDDDGPAFYLHALDLTSGTEKLAGPSLIAATVQDSVSLDAGQHLQRPGLLVANGMVYIGFGSHSDNSPWHGWIVSYDASDVSRQTGVFTSSPSTVGSAVWQSGRGLAADDSGSIYAVTGNGTYDGHQNFAESFLKLNGSLGLEDWFTPSNWSGLSNVDADLSAGPGLISGTHLLLGADKAGDLYVINGDAMGHLSASQTYPLIPSNSPGVQAGFIFNFAVWNRPNGAYVYVEPRATSIECYAITGGYFNPLPISRGAAVSPSGRIGMTLSASGATNGILWEITESAADKSLGTLHAFDASNLASELWNSDRNADRDSLGAFPKFVSPTVANGKVYTPTFSNTVVVYGLLASGGAGDLPAISAIANAASYGQDTVAPGEAVAIFGTNLDAGPAEPMQLNTSGDVASTLGSTSVFFDGIPAPLLYVSAGQINAVVPFGIATDSTQVQVVSQGQWSAMMSIPTAPASPGVFSADGSGGGQALVWNADGSQNSANHPATRGSVIMLYATGGGQLSPALQDGTLVPANPLPQPVLPVTARIGGQPASAVTATGVPGSVAGLLAISIEIPGTANPGTAVPIAIQVGDQISQDGLTAAIQ